MIRRRVPEQTRMRRGRFGWELVRPDKTTVEPAHLRNSRLSERLLREVLKDSDLCITHYRQYSPWTSLHSAPTSGAEARGEVFIPDPDAKPGEWSPFDDDGKLDEARLKREGWHMTQLFRDEG